MNKQTQKKLLDLVKESYDDIADDFNTTRQKFLWPEIVKLAGMVKDGDKVLDAGCGNGRLARAFVGRNIEYVGVDSSNKLIKSAERNFQFSIFNFQTNSLLPNHLATPDLAKLRQIKNFKQTQNFKFLVGDVLELDKLAEKDFDYVFSIAVLHHLPGEDLRIKALGQMKNKLSAHGRLIIAVWNLWTQKKFKKLIMKNAWLKLMGNSKMDWGDIIFSWRDNLGQAKAERYYHAFTMHGLKKIIKKSNLKIEKIYKDKYNYYAVLSQ